MNTFLSLSDFVKLKQTAFVIFLSIICVPQFVRAESYESEFSSGNRLYYVQQSGGLHVISVQKSIGIDDKISDIEEGEIQGSTMTNFPLRINGLDSNDRAYVGHILNGTLFITFQNGESVLVLEGIENVDSFSVSARYHEYDSIQWLAISFRYEPLDGKTPFGRTILINSNQMVKVINYEFNDFKSRLFPVFKEHLYLESPEKSTSQSTDLKWALPEFNFRHRGFPITTEENDLNKYSLNLYRETKLQNGSKNSTGKEMATSESRTVGSQNLVDATQDLPAWIRDARELLLLDNFGPIDSELLLPIYQSLLNSLNPSTVVLSESPIRRRALELTLAKELLTNSVPERLKNHSVYLIDANSLVSGSKYRGEFEAKIQTMVDLSRSQKIIWLIDSVHSLAGKGVHVGQGDGAFEMLQPYIERGEIQILGLSTTFNYSNTFTRPALKEILPSVILKDIDHHESIAYVKEYILEAFKYSFENDDLLKFMSLVDSADSISSSPDKYISIFAEIAAQHELAETPVTYDSNEVLNQIIDFYNFDPRVDDIPLAKETVVELKQAFDDELIGQKSLKNSILNMARAIATQTNDTDKPNYFYLLDGPKGLGKTAIVKIIGRVYGRNLEVINMGEYATSTVGAIDRLKARIYHAINKDPQTFFLFDELDKCPVWFQEGVLTIFGEPVLELDLASGTGAGQSSNSVKADLSRASYFFGSNAASDYIEGLNASRKSVGFTQELTSTERKPYSNSEHYDYLLESEKISTPLLSRISSVVPVFPPTESDFRDVLELHTLNAVSQMIENSGQSLELTLGPEELAKLLDLMVTNEYYPNRDNRVSGIINDYVRIPIGEARFENETESRFSLEVHSSGKIEFLPTTAAVGCLMLLE